MSEQREVLLTNLLLDLENPRLAAGQENQLQTIHAMLRAEGPKTLALADSIAAEGLSPMERFLVMPSPENAKRFIVLEGNRRVTALRILGEPTIADGGLTPTQQSKLQKASVLYRKRGEIDRVECVVFATRKEANPWIERRHRGDQGGLGIVRWGATESERFDARNSGKGSPALQVLDYVAEHGALDGATRAKLHDVSITNLKRLVADKSVREALGLDLDSKGRMLTRFPQAEVLKGLTRLIQDLAHEKIKVSDIYHATDRKNYISGFKSGERPSASKALGSATPLIGSGAPPGSSSAATAGRLVKESKPRLNLIPRTCALKIGVPKLARIATELRTLRLDRYPNGTSVLLRVFIELSVDALIEKHSLMSEQQAKGSKLRNKLTKAAEYLETKGRLTHKQGNAVRKAATDKHLLASSVTTLHEYLHNKDLAASPTELRTAWDNLEPFLRAIWP